MTPGLIDVALLVADALEACGLQYVVGGSVASSVSGEPRTTMDVDFVVAITEADVERVVKRLTAAFFIDTDAIRRAIRQRSTVNIIHQLTGIKVDLFDRGRWPARSSTAAAPPAGSGV